MTDYNPSTKNCPTCGSRLGPGATRCSVCGTVVNAAGAGKPVRVNTMPEITLSLPVVLGMIVLLLAIGAAVVYFVLGGGKPADPAAIPTITTTPTVSPTPSITPTETITPTALPTNTPLPPQAYTVKENDSCLTIAFTFDVSVQSIIMLNDLDADCTLSIGKELQIPHPTATPTPQPTSTLDPTQEAEEACETVDVIVGENDTLSGIAANYGITMDAIKQYNGMTSDIVQVNRVLKIPLCKRGPEATPSATPIPPYSAAPLLLPADGASFTSAGDTISLQWAAVGELRSNEAYAVTIEDVSVGNKTVVYVTETKYTIPETMRPADATPHTFRWSILPVRQTGSDQTTGTPIWEPAGAVSGQRVFSWLATK